MKIYLVFLVASIVLVTYMHTQKYLSLTSVESLASQLAASIESPHYDLRTSDGLDMDCLKITELSENSYAGIFHSGVEQKTHYSGLYAASLNGTLQKDPWIRLTKLSERGSQGYISTIQNKSSLLVLYELQNHQKGNTVAIRYYESFDKLKANSYLYEYQLHQQIDYKNVRNIGTPSIQNITLLKEETDPHKSKYNLTIKFHYSPDGQTDKPGFGWVDLMPSRDFVDSQGQWVGGSKQDYSDWKGNTDLNVQQAIARLGPYSKIGQRDLFTIVENGKTNKYYIYEVNMNKRFNWKDWRITLYSEKDKVAVEIPFSFGGDIDVANPHISQVSYNQSKNEYTFFLSFFLHSEGVPSGTQVKAGQFTALATIVP